MGNDAVCFEVCQIEGSFVNFVIGQATTIGCRIARRNTPWERWFRFHRLGSFDELDGLPDVIHSILYCPIGRLAAGEHSHMVPPASSK
jgi:hypothetical protein